MSGSLCRIFALAALVLMLGLLGCGKKDANVAATPAKAPVRKVVKPSDVLSPNMVAAVATSKGSTAPVQVKFELGGRPEPGSPLDIDLAIVPATDSLDRVSATVQGDDGLEIVGGATLAPTERPPAGTPIRHTVRVLPKRDGIFLLSAVVATDSAGQPASQTFSIPVIAGNGLAEAAAPPAPGGGAKPAPATAAQ